MSFVSLNLFGENVIRVKSPSGFGAAIAGERQLIPGKTYALCAAFDLAETLICDDNIIFDISGGRYTLTFTGTTLLKSADMKLCRLDDVRIVATNVSSVLWDFNSSSSTSIQTLTRCIISGFNSLGTINDSTEINWNHSTIEGFSNEVVLDSGNAHTVVNTTMDPLSSAVTNCVEWKGTWTDAITLSASIFFARNSGSAVFDIDSAFTSSGPITGELLSINASSGGVFLDSTGKDVNAPEVYFQRNGFTRGTVTGAEITLLNNTIITTFTDIDTTTAILGTSVAIFLSKFTLDGNELTYIGKKDITVRLVASVRGEVNARNERDTITIMFTKDSGGGFVDLDDSKDIQTLGDVLGSPICPPFKPGSHTELKEGDIIALRMENNTSTEGVVITHIKLNIGQVE